jgi:AraC family transcriptional regulator
MKRNITFFLILFLISTFFIYSSVEGKMQLKKKPAFKYTFIEVKGSFKQMPAKIQQFIKEFKTQGLSPVGTILTVYFNSPATVPESELRWRVGFPVKPGTIVKLPLKLAAYRDKTVLEFLHKGPYENLLQVYNKLLKYGNDNHLEFQLPCYEFYLNSPLQVKPEELLTRIEFEVKVEK